MAERKKLWTPEDGVTVSKQEAAALKRIKEAEIIKRRQEEFAITLTPSERETVWPVLEQISDKYVGQPITTDLKQRIANEITGEMERLGFKVRVSFNPMDEYQNPEVVFEGRVEFDIDEAAKMLYETKKRGGYKGDFGDGTVKEVTHEEE